jgi:hypothetical protein
VLGRAAWLRSIDAADPTAARRDRHLLELYDQQIAPAASSVAVLDAYGWPHDIADEEILTRLLALNLARAARQGRAVVASAGDEDDTDEGG